MATNGNDECTAEGVRVNGQWRGFKGVHPSTPLLWFLRDHCKLTGTKFGCGIAYCGACTVLLEINEIKDGRPVTTLQAIRSCVTPLSALQTYETEPGACKGSPPNRVVTIEGLAEHDSSPMCAAGTDETGGAAGERLHPVQQAWIECNVPQCGYCQSGQIMSAVALIEARRAGGAGEVTVTNDQIDQAMAGNLCRCGTYPRIRRAIKEAAKCMPCGAKS